MCTKEINRYISEAARVRRAIQIYSEFFDSKDSISVLYEISPEVAKTIRRAMHDEILISLARLFDSNSYTLKNNELEYLSQRNLIEKNIAFMTPSLKELRTTTSELWKEISISHYRNLKVAHNDKSTMIENAPIKHNLSYKKAAELVDTSIVLMLGLTASISGKDSVEIWADINDKNIGEGNLFIRKLRSIQK